MILRRQGIYFVNWDGLFVQAIPEPNFNISVHCDTSIDSNSVTTFVEGTPAQCHSSHPAQQTHSCTLKSPPCFEKWNFYYQILFVSIFIFCLTSLSFKFLCLIADLPPDSWFPKTCIRPEKRKVHLGNFCYSVLSAKSPSSKSIINWVHKHRKDTKTNSHTICIPAVAENLGNPIGIRTKLIF